MAVISTPNPPPITASMLYDLVSCSHRVTMDLFADPAERDKVSPFVQLLWERGTVYEEQVVADIGEPVHEALAAQKALSWLLGDYVFLGSKQKPVDQEIFRMKVWEPVLKRLGVRYRPPYQMRHTFATLAISAGENINWVARMLGHKSPVVTLEKYNRYVPNLTREDGRALLAANEMAKRSGPPEKIIGEYQ